MSGILEICPEHGVSPNASKPVDGVADASEAATVANSPEVGSFGQDSSLEHIPPMSKAQDLLETLQCVLSRENVATDPSLALIMRKDPQACQCNAIGVDQLLEHPAIARIEGISREDLIEALSRMDEKLVRFDAEKNWAVPVMVKERDTLVLRLPSEANEEDVNALLKAAPPIQGKVHISRQHNLPTVWYCELANAQVATEAALWLREQVICDQKVQVGIKSEPAYATFLSRPVNPPPSMKPGPSGGRRDTPLVNQFRGSNFHASSSPGGRGRGGNRRSNQRNGNGRRPFPKGRGGNRHQGGQTGEGIGSVNKRLDMSVDFPPLVEGARNRSNGYGTESFHQYSPEFLRQVKYKLDGGVF